MFYGAVKLLTCMVLGRVHKSGGGNLGDLLAPDVDPTGILLGPSTVEMRSTGGE